MQKQDRPNERVSSSLDGHGDFIQFDVHSPAEEHGIVQPMQMPLIVRCTHVDFL
jgi:hypothetical protein